MKLRIRGNSLRLRLTKTEVAQLASSGKVEEFVDFGTSGTTLVYGIEVSNDRHDIAATFDNGRICVYVPKENANAWTQTDLVGLESGQNDMKIVVEKDFACAQPRTGEDEADMFPNPASALCG